MVLHGLEEIYPVALSIGDELGKGKFKRVYKAWHKRKGGVVVMRYPKQSENTEMDLLLHLAKSGGSNFIPKILGIVEEATTVSIVQELATWGALKVALKCAAVAPKVSPTHKLHCALQLSRAMEFISSLNVVHADLSCRNILLLRLEKRPSLTVVKITDFGLALELREGEEAKYVKQPHATRWCSPETIAEMKLSTRSDIWAFGATLWELFSGGVTPWCKRPKRADVAARLRDLIASGGTLEGGANMEQDFPASSKLPLSANEVVWDCLHANEYKRPKFFQIADAFAEVVSDTGGTKTPPKTPPRRKPPIPIFRSAASTPSTTDTPPQIMPPDGHHRSPTGTVDSPLNNSMDGSYEGSMPAGPQEDEERQETGASRFQALKEFLQSPAAVQTLGVEPVLAMRRELVEAQVREAYWKATTTGMQARFDRLEAQIQEAKVIATTNITAQPEKLVATVGRQTLRDDYVPLAAQGAFKCPGPVPVQRDMGTRALWYAKEGPRVLQEHAGAEAVQPSVGWRVPSVPVISHHAQLQRQAGVVYGAASNRHL